MAINADKTHLWKEDVERSIDFYNDWFVRFAPETYRAQRKVTTVAVLDAFGKTRNLTAITPSVLHESPGLLPWVTSGGKPGKKDLDRAATVVADRMCGASSDPIIRNAQERRQLATLGRWLRRSGYREVSTKEGKDPYAMPPGTFAFRLSLPAGDTNASVKIPIDCVVQPLSASVRSLPVLIEAKSAGDATNTNKRRKEEAQKLHQLKQRYGDDVVFFLYLCGYFEPGYLGYEAAEGIDWVWEHRTSDFASLLLPAGKKKPRQCEKRR
jgi:hypothetical protein